MVFSLLVLARLRHARELLLAQRAPAGLALRARGLAVRARALVRGEGRHGRLPNEKKKREKKRGGSITRQ